MSQVRTRMTDEERASQRARDTERLAAVRDRVQRDLGEAVARSFPEHIPDPFLLGSRDFFVNMDVTLLDFIKN